MRYYCPWAGNPEGTPEDPRHCIVEVPVGGRSVFFRQCDKPRGEDGLCTRHRRRQAQGGRLSIPEAQP